jgi:predicted GNAT family N-acyltransferase
MKQTPTMRFEVRSGFSPAMELLRREYADSPWPDGTSEDEFDHCSIHITASVNGDLAGMVRLTKRPPSVLSAWAVGPHHLPGGGEVIEATRGVVARKWRGMDLYKVMMAEATRFCCAAGAFRAVGVIEPDFPLRDFLATIGFQNCGAPTRFHNPPKGHIWGQVIVQDVAHSQAAIASILARCICKLRDRGFTVRSTVLEYTNGV